MGYIIQIYMGQQHSNSIATIENDYELAIKISKDLEDLLVVLGAEGGGLNEKISICADDNILTPQILRDIRYIAYIRNKLIHEIGYDELPNREKFIERYQRSVCCIEKIAEEDGLMLSTRHNEGWFGNHCPFLPRVS